MIYLDYAATSGKKPEGVYEAVNNVLRNASGNPGRSGHRVSLEAPPKSMIWRAGLMQTSQCFSTWRCIARFGGRSHEAFLMEKLTERQRTD